jgi:Phage integrase family/Phage integrase, N-terminal SAM-like domain
LLLRRLAIQLPDALYAPVTFRGTRKQAEAELAKRLSELAEGRYVAPTVETVESYARHWLVNIAPAERSLLTLERYTSIIRAHIIPRLGPIPLQALDGKAIDGFYAHCRKQGRRDGFFTSPEGSAIHPVVFCNTFTCKTRAAGLKTKFHALRHLHITYLLKNGVPVHVVSARAGHSRASITLDAYSHLLGDENELAAKQADEILRGALGANPVPTASKRH